MGDVHVRWTGCQGPHALAATRGMSGGICGGMLRDEDGVLHAAGFMMKRRCLNRCGGPLWTASFVGRCCVRSIICDTV